MNIRSPLVAAALARATLPAALASDAPARWFTVADASGLSVTHFHGMSGELHDPEIMPPGVALFDCDNDGDLDVVRGPGTDAWTEACRSRVESAACRVAARRPPLSKRSQSGRPDAVSKRCISPTRPKRSGISARGYGRGFAAASLSHPKVRFARHLVL
jgi:hypothetical protein